VSSGLSVVAAAKESSAEATRSCTRSTGDVDRNRAPFSVSELVEQSNAVVAVRVRAKEQLVLQQSSGGSISFLMRSPVRVDEVVKGALESPAQLDLHRMVIGYDLDGALEQTRCRPAPRPSGSRRRLSGGWVGMPAVPVHPGRPELRLDRA
jgi:hypothetical protein